VQEITVGGAGRASGSYQLDHMKRWFQPKRLVGVIAASLLAIAALWGAAVGSAIAVVGGVVLLQLLVIAAVVAAGRQATLSRERQWQELERELTAVQNRITRALTGVEASLDAVRRESVVARRELEQTNVNRVREREHQWLLLNERVEDRLQGLVSLRVQLEREQPRGEVP
jgi:hypothetical protein